MTSDASELPKAFTGIVDFFMKGVLFPISFCVPEFLDAVRFFRIIRRCSFDALLALLTYRHSAETDWKDVCYVVCFPYKGKTDDVFINPKRQLPGKERDLEDILVIETLS